MPTTTEAASAAFDRLSRDIETVNGRAQTAQDSIPVADTTDFADLLDPAVDAANAAQQLANDMKARLDAMPNLVVVSDPALAPAGSIAVVVAP